MTFRKFSIRCFAEFNEKNKKKNETISSVISYIVIIGAIIATIFLQLPFFEEAIFNYVLSFFIYVFAGGVILNPIEEIYHVVTENYPRSEIENAARTGSYLNYPSNYPKSILYPGEPYPFNNGNKAAESSDTRSKS